jgi:hypothetical protein
VIGHKHVIDMRLDRCKPQALFLQVDQEPPWWWHESPWPEEYDRHPSIFVPAGEPFARLDLRFMVGLTVHLTALSIPRMVEALHACKRHAARVIATTYDPQQERVTYMTDTETNYVWQEG